MNKWKAGGREGLRRKEVMEEKHRSFAAEAILI